MGVTTDVWVNDGYAYTGTFNTPCGGDPEASIWVWDVHTPNKVEFLTIIESPAGSRTNDVRVATMNSGDVLVHSNESCGGGPGGFEINDVDDPANPVLLASVQTDDVNAFLRDNLVSIGDRTTSGLVCASTSEDGGVWIDKEPAGTARLERHGQPIRCRSPRRRGSTGRAAP